MKVLNLCDSNSWKVRIDGVQLVTINYPVDKTKRDNSSDINFNLNTFDNIPIINNTFDIVFSSHTFEHIRQEYLYNILINIHRILKPNGLFRIIVPNFRKSVDQFKNNNFNYFKSISKEVGTGRSNNIEDRFSRFNISFIKNGISQGPKLNTDDIIKIKNSSYKDIRELLLTKIPDNAEYYGHVNIIEQDFLISLLKQCKFKEINIINYGESRNKLCKNRIFNNRPNSSLFIECIK
tara:strand:+ start:151 stop:858 length:708 start_codon:yes stop_codon:yes gene_type:complete